MCITELLKYECTQCVLNSVSSLYSTRTDDY